MSGTRRSRSERRAEFDRRRAATASSVAEAARSSDKNRIRNSVYDFATERLGQSPASAAGLSGLLDMLPAVGDASAFEDSRVAFDQGALLEGIGLAGLGMVGAIPLAGDLVQAGAKGARAATGAAKAGSGGRNAVRWREVPDTPEGRQGFAAGLTRTKENLGDIGDAVDVREDYTGAKMFEAEDGSASVAVAPDGEINSLAKDPNSPIKGFSKEALTKAVENGGRWLNVFDTKVAESYAKAGFRPVGKLGWNDEYASDALKRAYPDKPSLVFMEYDPTYEGGYKAGSGGVPDVDDYDTVANELRARAAPAAPLPPAAALVRQASEAAGEGPAPTRVSTRLPTAKGATEDPLTGALSIDLASATEGDVGAHNIGLLADTPGLTQYAGAPKDELLEAYVDHTTENLRFLMDQLPEGVSDNTRRWYEGANRFSGALSDRYGVPRQSTSAALAALSPQKDWYQNASLAERVGDIMFAEKPAVMSTEMRDFISSRMPNVAEDALMKLPPGVTLDDIDDPVMKAVFLRSFDEVNNPRHYRSLSPTGELGDFVTSKSGAPQKVGWGSLNEISKAISALGSGGDMSVLSPLLGEQHKVRNFYNNIELPNSRFNGGDLTADTHAVAANQLRPLSGASTPVMQNFGSAPMQSKRPADWKPAKSSAKTGVKGTYGINMAPYFKVAEEKGLLPREVQSITWEAIRDLFEASAKTAKGSKQVDDIWGAVSRGEITAADARKRIFSAFGGYSSGGGGSARAGIPPEQAGARSYR